MCTYGQLLLLFSVLRLIEDALYWVSIMNNVRCCVWTCILQAVWSSARREDPVPGEAHVRLREFPESGDSEHHPHEAQPSLHLRGKGPR